jgi:hypothetical protein
LKGCLQGNTVPTVIPARFGGLVDRYCPSMHKYVQK